MELRRHDLAGQSFQSIPRQSMAFVNAQDQAHRRVLVVKRPVLLRIVAVQVHLAYIGMGQGAELQVDDDEAAQAPVEEQQIDAIPSLVDAQPPLSSNKREARRRSCGTGA